MSQIDKLYGLWNQIYDEVLPLKQNGSEDIFNTFISELDGYKKEYIGFPNDEKDWYKDAVVYSAYVDLFNKDFSGLTQKLSYLEELGINCLWLLPILDSPMKDAGFDISNYKTIRSDLIGHKDFNDEAGKAVFEEFVNEAHRRGIRLIFDIAMNHCSNEHPWFVEGKKSRESKYRDYFIWADDDKGYSDARIIFKGLCKSNWEYEEISEQYYLHRFFEIQPDLNYRNPEVLIEMTKVLVYWKMKGIDGFRADAVPYIWKEEGTICENLLKTHLVVKFFRAALDYLAPGSLLLAEACQPPSDVVEYFGEGDECNGAYHFPVMPRIYHCMASEDKRAIEKVLATEFTPQIPESSQWFMFLRCHDELTLEMVTPEERQYIYDSYVKDESWDFRQGEGISARLAELLEFNPRRILLAYSIMLTLPGTPIVYYGDEIAKGNDKEFFDKIYEETGYADTRYLGRGEMNWDEVDKIIKGSDSVGTKVYEGLKQMIAVRAKFNVFGRGTTEFIDIKGSDGQVNNSLLAYRRIYQNQTVTVIQNLSKNPLHYCLDIQDRQSKVILGNALSYEDEMLTIEGYGVIWLS